MQDSLGRRRETPGLQAENLQFFRHGAKDYTEGISRAAPPGGGDEKNRRGSAAAV